MNHTQLTDLGKLTRKEVVPYYFDLLVNGAPHDECRRINRLIISKWSNFALNYIKERAWRYYYLYIEVNNKAYKRHINQHHGN